MVVRLGNRALAEPNGQLRFEFSAEPGLAICPFPDRTAAVEDWFERGMRAEDEGDFSAAVAAYRLCLVAGGPAADAAFNLANSLYALRQAGGCRRAISPGARAGARIQRSLEQPGRRVGRAG